MSKPTYQAVKRILIQQANQEASAAAARPSLQQSGSDIRALGEYQAFWDEYAGEMPTNNHPTKTNAERSEDDANVDP